ncbi:hypothetical protein evm_009492 [Chilo suppressalis]|nr:hypothetical protein evm_009492 [Chilo suppressalis]
MLVKNVNMSITLSLTALRLVGFWPLEGWAHTKRILYNCYGFFCFMFLLGTYLVSQVVDMYLIWGDLPLMTGVSFVLFTNIAQFVKFANVAWRREIIWNLVHDADEALRAADSDEAKEIVRRCNRETIIQQVVFGCLTFVTMLGWATSAEKGQLPLRAWYPYDVTKSPAYELSYLYQIGALYVAAFLNVGKDTLVTCLIAQCRCRLQLLGLSLRNLCQGIQLSGKFLKAEEEAMVKSRLEICVKQHHDALETAHLLQHCFSEQVFMQFNVSLVIICVTAFQLVSVTGNPVRLIAMGTYLVNMMFQVFIYCYQGNQLSEESTKTAGAAYECPWYVMSTPLRRSLLIIMTRSRRVARITAAGFTTLSLASFMGIIKMSYSMFTLLQQLEVDG